MANSTPGPWFLAGYNSCIRSSEDGTKGDTICVFHGKETTYKNNANNGRLIAAAPEMYEALQQILPFVEEEQEVREACYLPAPDDQEEKELVQIAELLAVIRAALAKADGKAASNAL